MEYVKGIQRIIQNSAIVHLNMVHSQWAVYLLTPTSSQYDESHSFITLSSNKCFLIRNMQYFYKGYFVAVCSTSTHV